MRYVLIVIAFLLAGCCDDCPVCPEVPPVATLGSETLRPNETSGFLNEWTVVGAATAHEALDTDPDTYNQDDYIQAKGVSGVGLDTEIIFPDFTGPADAVITDMVFRVLYIGVFTGATTCYPRIRFGAGWDWPATQALPQTSSLAINEFAVGGLQYTPTKINNSLQFKLESYGTLWTKSTQLNIYGVEVNLTYTYTPDTGAPETITATSTITGTPTAKSNMGTTISIESLIE